MILTYKLLLLIAHIPSCKPSLDLAVAYQL